MRVFANSTTKCLVIASEGYALVLRSKITTTDKEERKKHRLQAPELFIEFVTEESLPQLNRFGFKEIFISNRDDRRRLVDTTQSINSGLGDIPYYTKKHERQFYGLLGLYTIKNSVFAGFITERTEVGSVVLHQKIYRIDNTVFISLSGDAFDYYYSSSDGTEPHENSQNSRPSGLSSIQKLLASGTFYYSPDYDMSSCVQERGIYFQSQVNKTEPTSERYFDSKLYDSINNRFVWNGSMIAGLVGFRGRLSAKERQIFDQGRFLLTIIRGFAQSLTINNHAKDSSEFILSTIISKQDCQKSGYMFGPYGMDDNGNVTNFIETEFIVSNRTRCCSFLLLRGNVPLFWKLETQLVSTKVQFPRSNEASKHAFSRHFNTLIKKYGFIHVIDALSGKGAQPEISRRYADAIKKNIDNDSPIKYTKIDTSRYDIKYGTDTTCQDLISKLQSTIESMHIFYCEAADREKIQDSDSSIDTSHTDYGDGIVIMHQEGVFLVNTLDSNKRSNWIQSKLSECIVRKMFHVFSCGDIFTWRRFQHNHVFLWDANGRSLKKLAESYNNSIRTKPKRGGIVGKVANQSKKYVSNTSSSKSGKQLQFDQLLGRSSKERKVILIDPIHNYVKTELEKRSNEYVSTKQLIVFAGTFNVNAEQFEGSIEKFIFPEPERYRSYDFVAIGLEEVIELTPGKIMNIDHKIRNFWETKLKDTLTKFNGDNYILLRGEQLGGILEFVFVKEKDNLKYIKGIETATKKTGMKGMAANKGGVGICLNYSNSVGMCFVASHLAAGLTNVDERHQDFKTIANGLRFSQNRMLRDFDIVIWMGDFNFRIDESNMDVRNSVYTAIRHPEKRQDMINKLFANDQLNKQMSKGKTFPFFDEKEITFLPTYKYDKGTSTFDTSEKQRGPAWTDRIVTYTRDKRLLQQDSYNSVESLFFSDHKPVYAIFNADVNIVDEDMRSSIERRLYRNRKTQVEVLNLIVAEDVTKTFGQTTLRYGLPAPSNVDHQWWNGKGEDKEDKRDGNQETTGSRIRFPQLDSGKFIINPALPKNPFICTTEPDFIEKKRIA